MSPRTVRVHLRPIALLAIGLVIVTTVVVALVAHLVIDNLTWAAAFVLGAIIAPIDSAATLAILERLHVPHRIVTILEGESLFNDATALVIYRVAVVAVVTGQFPVQQVFLTFMGGATGGIVIGLGIGWFATWIQRHLSDPLVEITASLLIPFAAWIPAELSGTSGVLAVVTAGMYVGQTRYSQLPPATRLRTFHFWEVLTFVLEGLLFILIGFQIPILLVATAAIPSPKIVGFALIVTLAAIFIRIIWTFGTTYLPMVLSHGSHQSTYPSWRETAIVAWAGMRGALSFVLALALPTVTNTGEAFPGRELIIFVTFGVILTTLLLHGLTLPTLIRWLRVEEAYEARKHETEEMVALRRLIEAALARVDELAAQPATPREALEKVRTQLLHQLHDLSGEVSQQHREQDFAVRQLEIEVLAAERREAARLYDQGVISDEVLNRIKQHLDMEELRLAMEESAFPQPPKS
jgi:CPA1 family monovalent cation:H+ antiporter